MEQKVHSKRFAPSKSAIWIKCPFSTLFNDGGSSEDTPQSIYGTQTHSLGEALIKKSLKLWDFFEIEVPIEKVIEELDMYDSGMQELADGYANFVISQYEYEKKRSGGFPFVVVEQHLDMGFDPDAGGTLDLGMISPAEGGTLVVIDLKTGRTPVRAYDPETNQFNTQLGLYALYFYKTYQHMHPIKKVRLVIYQPVIANTNEYEMPLEDLLSFEEEVLIPAVERANSENPEAVPNHFCKYCTGKAFCAKRKEENLQIIRDITKKANLLSNDEISDLLPKMDDLIQYAEDVKEYALRKALSGHKWPHFKLVHAKSARKITDEEAAAKVVTDAGYDPYGPRKILGIGELSRRLGKEKFTELLGPYISKPDGTLVLVSEMDPREEAQAIEKEE